MKEKEKIRSSRRRKEREGDREGEGVSKYLHRQPIDQVIYVYTNKRMLGISVLPPASYWPDT